MGQNFSTEPVVEKETERDRDDRFNVSVSSCQGWRLSQEDNHSLMLDLPGEHKAAFFAVFDGHGSAKVSRHASDNLWRHLILNEHYVKGQFSEALRESFLSFDSEVSESYNAQLAGTTAVCLLVVQDTVYCANIGDSRGVASVNCECVPLSADHKPENPGELKRILEAGGYVLGNRVNGNLALSRAFGDFHYKNNETLPPEQQIVSPCPDIQTLALNDDVDFLLLACDGIWDVLSSEEVVEFVISRLEQNMEPGLICEQLTTRCLATDYELVIGCDNMTVLLVCYTRGKPWQEYCTDIFNKNTKRLGQIRTKPLPTVTPSSSSSSSSPGGSSGDKSPNEGDDHPNEQLGENLEGDSDTTTVTATTHQQASTSETVTSKDEKVDGGVEPGHDGAKQTDIAEITIKEPVSSTNNQTSAGKLESGNSKDDAAQSELRGTSDIKQQPVGSEASASGELTTDKIDDQNQQAAANESDKQGKSPSSSSDLDATKPTTTTN